MIKSLQLTILFIVLGSFVPSIFAQDNSNSIKIEQKLNSLSADIPALDHAIDISMNGVSVQDFVRAVGQNASININIDPNIKANISNDFTQVKVKNILLFLCKEYGLDIEVIGNIISLRKANIPVEAKAPVQVKVPVVEYDSLNNLLSIDSYNDTLRVVAKAIADRTGKSIVCAPGTGENIVSTYIKNMPLESVLDKLAFANNLVVEKTSDNYFLLKKKEDQSDNSQAKKKNGTNSKDAPASTEFDYKIDNGLITIHAENTALYDMIKTISGKLAINHTLISDIQGASTIHIEGIDYEHFLVRVLDGTNYTYFKDGDIYLIGETKNTSLTATEIYNLRFRTVDKIKDFIPADLTKDVKVIEMVENNSLIMTGNSIGITKMKDFIMQIDRVVPVVLIEVTILDVTDSYKFSSGLRVGLSDGTTNMPPSTTNGSILPGIDLNFSTKAINSVVNGINGLGWIKLGNVSSNFYASLKLMEDNNVVKIKSTPMLSTLNGHEAALSSGETRYYKEERIDYIGVTDPKVANSYTWKPLNADLTINIKPIVSGDGQITLEIEVQQSEFTAKASPDGDAPYNSVKRNFKSSIRMKDQEVILLGGLERNKSENSGSGIPFLARIPVIKWFFSSREKGKENTKLNVFIKPTVIY